jgi:hypothetical protein
MHSINGELFALSFASALDASALAASDLGGADFARDKTCPVRRGKFDRLLSIEIVPVRASSKTESKKRS